MKSYSLIKMCLLPMLIFFFFSDKVINAKMLVYNCVDFLYSQKLQVKTKHLTIAFGGVCCLVLLCTVTVKRLPPRQLGGDGTVTERCRKRQRHSSCDTPPAFGPAPGAALRAAVSPRALLRALRTAPQLNERTAAVPSLGPLGAWAHGTRRHGSAPPRGRARSRRSPSPSARGRAAAAPPFRFPAGQRCIGLGGGAGRR